MVHEEGCVTFEGTFTDFVWAFAKALRDVDQYDGIDPADLEFLEKNDLDELIANDDIGPREPNFRPF